MSSEASFDGYHSPATKSVSQLPTQNYYFDSPQSMSPVEQPEPHRQMISRMPVQPAYAAPAFASSYMSSPAMASYYPTMQPTPPPQPQVSGLYYQRPLPQVSTIILRIMFQRLTSSRLSHLCPWASQCHHPAPTHGNTTTTFLRHLQHLSHSPRTATSAKLATRPSPAPALFAFTATLTLVRSLSSVPMLAAARLSVYEAT